MRKHIIEYAFTYKLTKLKKIGTSAKKVYKKIENMHILCLCIQITNTTCKMK